MPVIKDVLIGLPIYDNRIEADILQECLAAVQDPECVVAGIQYYNGDSLIPRGRNKIAKMFLDSEAKYLMFIDSDIRFKRGMINRLRSHDKGIMCGPYMKKTIPYAPVLNSVLGQEGELFVVREAGTGFMMIRRDVFGAFRSMWPEHDYQADGDEQQGTYHDWFRVGVKDGRYLSEDYYFCQLAGKLGIKTYMDTSFMTEHIGKMAYPMPEDKFLTGASELMKRLNVHHKMDEKLFTDIIDSASEQYEKRTGKKYGEATTEQRTELPEPKPYTPRAFGDVSFSHNAVPDTEALAEAVI